MDHSLSRPVRLGPGRDQKRVLAAWLLLATLLNMLAGCGSGPTPVAVVTSTLPASPTSSPPPTLPPLPTVPVALISRSLRQTATPAHVVVASPAPSAVPTERATATASPFPSPSPTATPTSTHTPVPTLEPSPSPAPTLHPNPSPVPTSALTQDVIHILLIGGDTNYAPDMNTDTLIIAVVNRDTKQVSFLSIPRDLWVYIPTYGWGRINTAHRIGSRTGYEGYGPGLLARTIEENLGIPIDHWVRISYDGFRNIVDAMGGVDLVVPCAVNLRYQPPTSSEQQEIILAPGVHHLDGATALRYVRTRRGDTDFGRSGRQQQFLKSVWEQMMTPEIIPKIPALWSGLKDNFQTSLKLGDILALAPMALDLQHHRIRSRYIGPSHVEYWTTPEGWSVLLPIPEKIESLVSSIYAPPASRGDKVVNEQARVEVWNGTERPYLARIAADQLGWQGLQVAGIAVADRTDYRRTHIIVFNDKPEAVALLANLLDVRPDNIIQQPDAGQAVDIRVILGQDYDPCR